MTTLGSQAWLSRGAMERSVKDANSDQLIPFLVGIIVGLIIAMVLLRAAHGSLVRVKNYFHDERWERFVFIGDTGDAAHRIGCSRLSGRGQIRTIGRCKVCFPGKDAV